MAVSAIAFAATISLSAAAAVPHQGADALGIDVSDHVKEPVCTLSKQCAAEPVAGITIERQKAIGETVTKPDDALLLTTLTDDTGTTQWPTGHFKNVPSEPGMWKSLSVEVGDDNYLRKPGHISQEMTLASAKQMIGAIPYYSGIDADLGAFAGVTAGTFGHNGGGGGGGYGPLLNVQTL